MKKVLIYNDGRIFDAYYSRNGKRFMDVSIYEVKRPDRKRIGRTKWYPFATGFQYIDNYDTLEDLLMDVLEKGLRVEEKDLAREKKLAKWG